MGSQGGLGVGHLWFRAFRVLSGGAGVFLGDGVEFLCRFHSFSKERAFQVRGSHYCGLSFRLKAGLRYVLVFTWHGSRSPPASKFSRTCTGGHNVACAHILAYLKLETAPRACFLKEGFAKASETVGAWQPEGPFHVRNATAMLQGKSLRIARLPWEPRPLGGLCDFMLVYAPLTG